VFDAKRLHQTLFLYLLRFGHTAPVVQQRLGVAAGLRGAFEHQVTSRQKAGEVSKRPTIGV
jgi:hypothetical protein